MNEQQKDWQKIAESRLEKIQNMSSFLDGLAAIVGIPKPQTPEEGLNAVPDLITAIQVLTWEESWNSKAIDSLRSVISDADKYLDTNKLTNIGSGSSLHNAFKSVLASTVPITSPLLEMMHQAANPAEKAEAPCTWTQPEGSELEESDCYQAECDGSTVTLNGPASETDMERCYRCGRKIVLADRTV